MLNALKEKFPDRNLHLIPGSYFDIPLGHEIFDAAVSVESLHHFIQLEKIKLYTGLHDALKPGGYFILTDYFALSDEEENMHRQEFLRLKKLQGIEDDGFYHYDTPLTVAHEIKALQTARFSSVEILGSWGATHTLKAYK